MDLLNDPTFINKAENFMFYTAIPTLVAGSALVLNGDKIRDPYQIGAGLLIDLASAVLMYPRARSIQNNGGSQ